MPTVRSRLILIGILSLVVLVAVPVLLYLPNGQLGMDVSILPRVNAVINTTVSLLLLLGLYLIRTGQRQAHRVCMLTAFGLSALFLVSYVIYHYQAQETKFGGEGAVRYFYYFVLLTHIVLAAVIVPLVLLTLDNALRGDYARHKKLARYTWPLWLYVSVTGVIVYLLISPYYPKVV